MDTGRPARSTQYPGLRKGSVECAGRRPRVKLAAMESRHDDHLRNARVRLLARAAELRERIQRIHADLGREREPLPRDSADAAIVMENDEVLRVIESTASAELHHIDHALERLDVGGYGLCEKCGAGVGDARLALVPYATRCERCERSA